MRATHNRTILAARAAERQAANPTRPTTVGTNPGMRQAYRPTVLRSEDGGIRKGKRSKGRGLGHAQRDSTGRVSDWTRSPFEPIGGWS